MEIPERPQPFLPHVLTVMSVDEHNKEWEVEHHPDCPLACYWWPGRDGDVDALGDPLVTPSELSTLEGDGASYICYVQYELDGNGIDSLSLGEVDDHLDPAWTPFSEFEAEWHRLRPGRYLIKGWFTPGGWAGEYYDADGGLTLIGPAT